MIASIVLAAGKGTRMKSKIPKVLHKVSGKSLIWHVCQAASYIGVEESIIVVGHQAEEVKRELGDKHKYALQEKQLGTGHAVMQAKSYLSKEVETIIVLCGDTPLLTGLTLRKLLEHHQETKASATILSAILSDPSNYGRIVRDARGQVKMIIEERDALPQERAIKEINSGTYCFNREALFSALKEITPENKQGEYYLTDVIEILVKNNRKVEAIAVEDPVEISGINNRIQLAEAEKVFQKRINQKWMLEGVTIFDPDVTYIETSVEIGMDTVVLPFSYLKGDTKIGEDCIIGPQTTLENTHVGRSTHINNTITTDAKIGSNCRIGPFSYIRPGTELADNVKIGDFVEIKKSFVDKNSKIPHLSYIGDCTIGENVNVGAGTITCNYDGKDKWQTILEDGSFIGSNTNLVAPVTVGKNATIGAGSTITQDVPAEALAVARQKQRNILNWTSRKKK
ncbi:MAG: bifunctional UDP-N-acetylglucosamine diphosphorylase/glucosamine-1-phosphate N-acetyltransferase GlmU [Clostridia bacterium]|nr:bifunctional UDP-N-acetylglucosamine diphosphorylase/glucosamine-1-phosphate N-acetyltransferase GlmU [Clostridia bacterium]